MTHRWQFSVALSAVLGFVALGAQAQEPTEAQRAAAVNQAGRLRFLSQKICKDEEAWALVEFVLSLRKGK